jgi:molecular chaperone GrpE
MAKKTQKTEKQEEVKDQNVSEETLEEQVETTDESTEEQEEPVEEKSKEEELEEKLAELQDRYLRLSAEYDNYRKRSLKEKIELLDGAKEDVFINILPVVDDLERALDMVQSAKDLEAVKDGMTLIYTKFTNYLSQQGLKEIEALNKKLDTDQHEAITKIPVENKKKKGKIVDVIEKGYKLRDKVIRFAKVVIGE